MAEPTTQAATEPKATPAAGTKPAASPNDAVEVTAIKEGWKHQGKPVPVGDTVTVTKEQANMLKQEKFVE